MRNRWRELMLVVLLNIVGGLLTISIMPVLNNGWAMLVAIVIVLLAVVILVRIR